MKVSQAAIDEVRAVRLADEAVLRREKLAGLTRIADCCATCSYGQGWLGDWFCAEHEIDTEPYRICDDHENKMVST